MGIGDVTVDKESMVAGAGEQLVTWHSHAGNRK